MWNLLNNNSGAVQAITAVFVGVLTLVLAVATLRYVNIGSGPALQVNWSVTSSVTGLTGMNAQGFIPYVQSGDAFGTYSVSHVKMGGFQFHIELECRYESLSGTRYVSKTVVDQKKVVSFVVRPA